MPADPADSPSDAEHDSKLPGGPKKKPGMTPVSPSWQSTWWYLPLLLLMLWFWQDLLNQVTVNTIPYSQFKQYLAADEVKDCEVRDTEIVGQIIPKSSQPSKSAAASEKSAEKKPPSHAKSPTQNAVPERKPSAESGKTAAVSPKKIEESKSSAEK